MPSLILTFLVLLGLSAFFSCSETALFSLSNVQLKKLGKMSGRSGSRLVKSLSEPRKLLVTILLGNELVNVTMSIVGAAMIVRTLSAAVEVQMITAIVVITPIILVVGEILPKNLALKFAPQLAPVVIWPLGFFYRIMRPLRALLTMIADRVVVLFGGEPAKAEPMIMENEFKKLVDLGRKRGVIVEEERELIHNVFDFGDKVVMDIMTPAERIFVLSADLPYERMLEEIKSVQFSRVPFYDDNHNNIIGVLHVRDLFAHHRRRLAGEKGDVRGLLHLPLFITPAMPLESLLKEFQRTQMHMAIVRDPNGSVLGLVTMDDVLEELFGEIE